MLLEQTCILTFTVIPQVNIILVGGLVAPLPIFGRIVMAEERPYLEGGPETAEDIKGKAEKPKEEKKPKKK